MPSVKHNPYLHNSSMHSTSRYLRGLFYLEALCIALLSILVLCNALQCIELLSTELQRIYHAHEIPEKIF